MQVQKVALLINGKQVEILNTGTFNLEVKKLQKYKNIFLIYAVQKYISGRESPQLNLCPKSSLLFIVFAIHGLFAELGILACLCLYASCLQKHSVISVYMHCKENPICVFLFWELRGLSPNFHIHVSVSDLYISHRYMSAGTGRQNIIILFWK